jgi:hypothetical protein
MCTVLVLLRPDHPWPLLIGENRDERTDRASLPPGRHWSDAPGILAGRDLLGGGSWFGVNDDGVVATIINGAHRLGPLPGKASRGELVIRALREPTAARAVGAIAALSPEGYRGFTMLIADRRSAFALANDERTIRIDALAPGHHIVTPEGCDVAGSPRYDAHAATFRAAPPPEPTENLWSSWIDLLRHEDDDDPRRGLTIRIGDDIATVSSALVAVPAEPLPPVFLFADGPATRAPYQLLSSPWVHGKNVES